MRRNGKGEFRLTLQQMPQNRSQNSWVPKHVPQTYRGGKIPDLFTVPPSTLAYSSTHPPFDNSSLSQAVIVPHLCQLVAQLLSLLVGFQPPLQRCRGWEFGRGLILNLAAQSQLRQTGSPRPRPDAWGGTNTPSSRGKTISGRELNCPCLHPRGFQSRGCYQWLPPSNPSKIT